MPDPDPFIEHLEPLSRLRRAVAGALSERGLRLEYLSIMPGHYSDGPHAVQIMATLANSQPAAPVDDGFDEVLRSARAAELERRSQETMEDLQRRLSEGDGFI